MYERRPDGRQGAHLVALARAAPPEVHARWGLHLLVGGLVRLEAAEAVSHKTVRRTLKKAASGPVQASNGA